MKLITLYVSYVIAFVAQIYAVVSALYAVNPGFAYVFLSAGLVMVFSNFLILTEKQNRVNATIDKILGGINGRRNQYPDV